MSSKKIKRLKHETKIEYTEKRSVFIGYSTIVKNEDEALEIIKQKKKEYADATHNVYAYVIGDSIFRYSDDNEPQGTAGMPVLSSIRMSGLTDVLVVVTRYFGGILLGAGGLVRAYSTCASMALEAGEVEVFEDYSEFEIQCSYSDYGKLITMLHANDAKIDNTDFGADVTVNVAVRTENSEFFVSQITDLFAGRVVPIFTNIRIDSK